LIQGAIPLARVPVEGVTATTPNRPAVGVQYARHTSGTHPNPWSRSAFSPDGRWISFIDARTNQNRIALLESGTVTPENAWIRLPLNIPEWSPDGRTVYGTANLDGSRCIWGQRLNDTTRAAGSPIPIFHSHSGRRTLSRRISVASDKLAFSTDEHRGNIWMAEWKSR